MDKQDWSPHLTAGMIAVVLLSAAGAAAGETPPQAAPANLRDRAGQNIGGGKNLAWKYAEIAVEWGFKTAAEDLPFDGSIQSTHSFGMLGNVRPLPGDKQTTMTGPLTWKSPAGGEARRGIVVPVLYTPAVRGPARTILTIRTSSGSFSFQPVDLETGPILAPEWARPCSHPKASPSRKPSASWASSIPSALSNA